ncbi:hypothetical protein WA577_004360 [Blastocystis sp. JDR]
MDPVEERKKRIEALKKKKAQLEAQRKQGGNASETTQTIRFRNYVPTDANLKERVDTVVVNETTLDYKESMKEATDMPSRNEEINLAPKKPNWDLKKGIEYKLDRLEKETQKAITSLLKQKAAAEDEED